MLKIIQEKSPTLEQLQKELHPGVKRKFSRAFRSFVAVCLQKNPDER